MVAAAPYYAAAYSAAVTVTSVLKHASTGLPSGAPAPHYNSTGIYGTISATTQWVYETVTVCPCTDSLASLPTPVCTNPNGPYDNPYDTSSLPFHWPGLPTAGQTSPGPKPTPPFPYGGKAAASYVAPAWVPVGCSSLVPSLPQSDTNGNSPWGLIGYPHLPGSLPCSGEATSTLPPFPTATGTASSVATGTGTVSAGTSVTPSSTPASACGKMPDTGVTRSYDFHVSYQTIAPDGVKKNGLVVNGQYPGPLVEANWGDFIEVKVTNDLPNEGTAIHFHGLTQKDTPWYDGVPAVAQCPVAPTKTFTLTFRADRYGSSWYHSHYSAQYAGGALGPVVIHGPRTQEYDIDIGPVLVSDHFHQDYFTLINQTMAANFPPSNNNLINGKMNYPCENTTLPCTPNAGISKFRFQSGKKHLLRVINTSAEGTEKFSIDNHTLTVIANDFVPCKPYTTNVVTLGVAQRADIIVEAIGKPSDVYWMRSQLGTNRCTLNDGVSPNAVAAVYYEDADDTTLPDTKSDVTADQLAVCKNDALNTTEPYCPIGIAATPATTEQVDITFASNGTNFVWFMNNSTFRGDYNAPILLQVNQGNDTFEPKWNVHDFGSNSSVRMIFKNHGLLGGHPMHLHGHDFQVLAEGFGDWDGKIVNQANPTRRDTHILQNAQDADTPSYAVFQWEQDNAGVWPFHCHLAWHVSGGLYINVLEQKEQIKAFKLDSDNFDGCKTWDAFTNNNIPDQIDSGL
ncbi:hypothetical protein BU16DRAFT_226331 [Lophium mytilinum]|uniref:Multicopper oxidase n=1 Tax=Lophium mytilinum TaxID=390894 RepID=A0A6A6Q7X7_9PEZI|nr:hypothetical protein BU16DRAFT_226331 [Lophium mytilinum]